MSLSVDPRQAQTHTLYRQRGLRASAGGLGPQDGAVDPSSELLESSEFHAVILVCATRRLRGEGNTGRIVRTWARGDAVPTALLFVGSLVQSVRLAQSMACKHRSPGIVSTCGGCQ